MIAVAERINGMFKDVKRAIKKKDKKVLQDLALRQTEQGAKYLDINTGVAVLPRARENYRLKTLRGNGVPSLR